MPNVIHVTKHTLQHLFAKVLSLGKNRQDIPTEIKQAILECQTLEELLDLLFATDFHKDEAVIKLFERRMWELDPLF